jgi:hypothetical protein
MKDTLINIQTLIRVGAYKNEEHIRLSLVARILQELGWNIWDPMEVYTEYVAVPTEDRTKVDIALFENLSAPSAFIEVKALGYAKSRLRETEIQLRDYNRNNTALFSIITDGREWRFYYSQTGGEFSEKLFRVIDLLDSSLDDIEQSFIVFLGKASMESGAAKLEAERYLLSNKLQRAVADCLPQARRAVTEFPFPSLPDSLVTLLKQRGFTISREEAIAYARESKIVPDSATPIAQPQPVIRTASFISQAVPRQPVDNASDIRQLNLDNLGDLRWTRILEGKICGEYSTRWNRLVEIGIRNAIQNGFQLSDLGRQLSINLKEGDYNEKGFILIPQINISMQRMDSDQAGKNAVRLARLLQCEIYIVLEWLEKSPFAGQKGIISWKP